MFQFIKANINTAITMMVNQFGMMIFSLMLSLATFKNEALFMWSSVFAICFYMFLLYTVAWELGANDKIRVDSGRIKYTPFKGFFISLLANTLNLLFSVLSCLGYLFMTADDKITKVAETSPKWASSLYAIFFNISKFAQSMYIGVAQAIFGDASTYNPFILLLYVVPALAISFIGYFVAIKGKSIAGLFGINIYKNKRA